MLNLVTARARTRGKSPQEFQFQAIGRLRPRKVIDKEGNPILIDAERKPVAYDSEKLEKDKDGNAILPTGTQWLEVDDVETSGLTDNFQEVLDLLGKLSADERNGRAPLQMAIDMALDGYNYVSRSNAAPKSETAAAEDELTPITAALVGHKILDETQATNWRRIVTQAAKTFEQPRKEYAQSTPQYKKLLAAGWKPAETVAA